MIIRPIAAKSTSIDAAQPPTLRLQRTKLIGKRVDSVLQHFPTSTLERMGQLLGTVY